MASAEGRPSARTHAGERDARALFSVGPQNPKNMLGVGRFRVLDAHFDNRKHKTALSGPFNSRSTPKMPAHPIFQIPSGNGRLINGPPSRMVLTFVP